jgi:hypothetical protein
MRSPKKTRRRWRVEMIRRSPWSKHLILLHKDNNWKQSSAISPQFTTCCVGKCVRRREYKVVLNYVKIFRRIQSMHEVMKIRYGENYAYLAQIVMS